MRAGVRAPQVELRSGEAVEQILNPVVQRKIDLLVFGCRGHNAKEGEAVLGGTAFRLASLAPCAVAIAR